MHISGKVGSPMTCSFEYHGEGIIRRVIKGCSCTSYKIDGNKVHLTFKKGKSGNYTQVVSAEVVNGKSTMHILKVKLNVTED